MLNAMFWPTEPVADFPEIDPEVLRVECEPDFVELLLEPMLNFDSWPVSPLIAFSTIALARDSVD